MALSLSAFLTDLSVDHTGPPIPVEYSRLWSKTASADRQRLRTISQEDIDFIRQQLAPAVAEWEWEQGNTYYHEQWPIHDRNAGLEGAQFVPIRLNLGEDETIDSSARMMALIKNDFAAKRATPLPPALIPTDLVRWRIGGPDDRLKNKLPAHYLVWQSEHEALLGAGKGLYARIPKPLEGLSRADSCDHCRIHDPTLVREMVDYFDDRPGVDGIRGKRAVDSAATPFSLCRFHWWYVQSGQLLRRSHVHGLEILPSEELLERWGFFHMKEFLDSVGEESLKLYERDMLDLETAWSLIPTGLLDNDPWMGSSPPPLTRAEAANPQDAESPRSAIVPQETVASTDEQPLVLDDQAAVTATADTDQQTNDAPASDAPGIGAPNSTALVAHSQTNCTSAKRSDGFLYSPPKMPRTMRPKFHRNRKRG